MIESASDCKIIQLLTRQELFHYFSLQIVHFSCIVANLPNTNPAKSIKNWLEPDLAGFAENGRIPDRRDARAEIL